MDGMGRRSAVPGEQAMQIRESHCTGTLEQFEVRELRGLRQRSARFNLSCHIPARWACLAAKAPALGVGEAALQDHRERVSRQRR